MAGSSADRIVQYLGSRGQATATDLANQVGISRQAVYKQLSKLLQRQVIRKIGQSPRVFYLLAEAQSAPAGNRLNPKLQALIAEHFLVITPAGVREAGLAGFQYWCAKQGLPLEKTAGEYASTLKKYLRYQKGGLINGRYKLAHTFPQVFLDQVFYLDFYSIERFGKTKLGQLLLYAKQSQDRKLIRELVEQIRVRIDNLITTWQVEAVAYIPPTVRRETQLMRELEKQLHLSLPVLKLVKIKTPVVVPQKTLNKLEDRVENAKSTIIVDDRRQYGTVLLLDDALGSGATMNETAKKLKRQNIAQRVIGLAITGSFSGFEVISEV